MTESPAGAASGPSSDGSGAAGLAGDWPEKAVGAVDLVVDTLHDKALRPVMLAARAVVFGLLIATLSLVVLILLAVGLVRLLNVYAFNNHVWISYAIIGAVFSVGGLLIWTKRTAGPIGRD